MRRAALLLAGICLVATVAVTSIRDLPLVQGLPVMVVGSLFVLAGVLASTRRPDNPSGRLLSAAGLPGSCRSPSRRLATRIVEQVVHLDDLARSVDHDPWPMPAGATDLAIAVGIDIARRRSGSTAVIRALYRRGWSASLFPVL